MIIDEVKVTERGWAGHFICAYACKFKRNTLLEYKDKKWVVSTVGALKSDSDYIEIGFDRYYETMAFEAEQDGIYLDANVDEQIDFESKWAVNHCDVNSDYEANLMHDNVVTELIKKIKE